MNTSTISNFVAAVLILAFIILTPLLLLWVLNTLFPVLAIPYTLSTWAASFVLISFVQAGRGITIKNNK